MARPFLYVLREKVIGLARRFRALALRFARRYQPADDSSSTTTAPVSSAAAPAVVAVRVPPVEPATSSAAADAAAPRFEAEARAPEGATSGGTGRRDTVAAEVESGRSKAQSEGLQPADHAAAEAGVIDGDRAAPEGEAAVSEGAAPHEVKSGASSEREPASAAAEPQPHRRLGLDAGPTPRGLEEAAADVGATPSTASEPLVASTSEAQPPTTAAAGDISAGAPTEIEIGGRYSEEPSLHQAAAPLKGDALPETAEEKPQTQLRIGEGIISSVREGVADEVQADAAPAPSTDRDITEAGEPQPIAAGDRTAVASSVAAITPPGADEAGPSLPPRDFGDDVERLPGANAEHEHIDRHRTLVHGSEGPCPSIADAAAGIDAGLGDVPEDGGGAQEDDQPEVDDESVDQVSDPRKSPPSERRQRARIDSESLDRPVLVSAPPIEDVDYRLWNRALATHCLLVDEGNEALYLTITPTILAAALCEVQPGRLLPEDAEAAFLRSVTAVYHGSVLGHRERLRALRRCGPDGLPDCIAFLAASVLAAYQMRSDEEAAATAYYARLADLLKCDVAGGHPRGFDPDEFEALWRFLEMWLRANKGRRLALPGPAVGLRRFVALPLTHVPLRRVDIERLPEFFAWAGYEPGAKIGRSRLDHALVDWSLSRTPFTNAGMAALADDRREAVLAQIAHELESWDGSHMDSLGRRSGRVEILLDIVQRRPELYYLPRRPAAFPQVFDDGEHAFEASDEGWYDPVPIRSEDGRDLAEGFEWYAVSGRLRLVLRRPGVRAIALPASHEYTGYLSHRALQLGAPGAALCGEALARLAAEYLSGISAQRCVPLNHPGLPDGWRLFTGIKPQRKSEAPPAGLEALAVEAAVNLIPVGGLRLGSRWAWLAGAPPRLMMAGLEVGERVAVDGEPVAVAEDGTLTGLGQLTRPGTHIVEAAGLRRRIEIVESEVRCGSQEHGPLRTVVVLPRGSWTLVGATPGEVALPAFRSRRGAVAWCAFPVVWAVEVGAGPDARVLCLSPKPPSPSRVPQFPAYGPVGRGLQAWASAVYNASIRRPAMETLNSQASSAAARSAWAGYVQTARDIKRQFKKARR